MRVVCYEVNRLGSKIGPSLLDAEIPQVIEDMIIDVDGKLYLNITRSKFVFRSNDRGGDTELSHIEMGFVPCGEPF